MKKYFLPLFFLLCNFMFAQLKPGPPNELDNKYSPGQSSIFNGSDANISNNNSNNTPPGAIEIKNLVKCNLALIPRNIFALSYERFFTDQISVEGSLGIAYNKDIIFGIMGTVLDFTTVNNNSTKLPLTKMYNDGKKSSSGLYTGAAVKFHFSGGGGCSSGYGYYSGWNWGNDADTYLELGFRYYGNHLGFTDPDGAMANAQSGNGSSAALYNGLTVDVRQVNYYINYGYRFTTTGNIKTSHELYVGVGLRNTYYDEVLQQQITTQAVFPQQGYTFNEWYKTGVKLSASSPMFVMGYILGFGWN